MILVPAAFSLMSCKRGSVVLSEASLRNRKAKQRL